MLFDQIEELIATLRKIAKSMDTIAGELEQLRCDIRSLGSR